MDYLIKEIDEMPASDDLVTSEEIKIDIIIHNITSSFEAGCEIDFEKVPEQYIIKSLMKQRQKNLLTKNLMKQAVKIVTFKINNCTIVMRNSGKLLSMGASSEDQALSAAQKSIEMLRSWGFEATFNNYKISTLFCLCIMPWKIQIKAMVTKYQDLFTSKSELSDCCVMKMNKKEGFLGVNTSGTIRIVGHTTEMVVNILERVLPFLAEFRV